MSDVFVIEKSMRKTRFGSILSGPTIFTPNAIYHIIAGKIGITGSFGGGVLIMNLLSLEKKIKELGDPSRKLDEVFKENKDSLKIEKSSIKNFKLKKGFIGAEIEIETKDNKYKIKTAKKYVTKELLEYFKKHKYIQN